MVSGADIFAPQRHMHFAPGRGASHFANMIRPLVSPPRSTTPDSVCARYKGPRSAPRAPQLTDQTLPHFLHAVLFACGCYSDPYRPSLRPTSHWAHSTLVHEVRFKSARCLVSQILTVLLLIAIWQDVTVGVGQAWRCARAAVRISCSGREPLPDASARTRARRST